MRGARYGWVITGEHWPGICAGGLSMRWMWCGVPDFSADEYGVWMGFNPLG